METKILEFRHEKLKARLAGILKSQNPFLESLTEAK